MTTDLQDLIARDRKEAAALKRLNPRDVAALLLSESADALEKAAAIMERDRQMAEVRVEMGLLKGQRREQ